MEKIKEIFHHKSSSKSGGADASDPTKGTVFEGEKHPMNVNEKDYLDGNKYISGAGIDNIGGAGQSSGAGMSTTTDKLYKEHPKDLNDAYLMGKGELGDQGGHYANVSGLSGAAAAGNVYEKDAIPDNTGLDTVGKPTMGEGSEAFDTADPTSAYQGLDATYPAESGVSRDFTSTTGTGAGLTGAALTDRSLEGSTLPSGPHTTFTGNRLDPNFQETIPSFHEETAGHFHEGGSSSHTHGRDAAIGGAGVGAAGVGVYGLSQGTSTTGTGPASNTKGPHDSNFANVVDPRVQPGSQQVKTAYAEPSTASDHHYVRDAAVVGGTGVAGAGAYEYENKNTSTFGGTKATDENIHHGRDQFDQGASIPKRGSVIGEERGGLVAPTSAFDSQDPTAAKTSGFDDGTPATHEKKHGLSSLLHRDHPSKLHKDPPGGSKYANAQTTDDGRVIEPRTGLPMNVEKYGTGTGGTDGNSNIGYDQSADPAAWDKVKKANTPY